MRKRFGNIIPNLFLLLWSWCLSDRPTLSQSVAPRAQEKGCKSRDCVWVCAGVRARCREAFERISVSFYVLHFESKKVCLSLKVSSAIRQTDVCVEIERYIECAWSWKLFISNSQKHWYQTLNIFNKKLAFLNHIWFLTLFKLFLLFNRSRSMVCEIFETLLKRKAKQTL
jgi:hypothetical protein